MSGLPVMVVIAYHLKALKQPKNQLRPQLLYTYNTICKQFIYTDLVQFV